MLETQYERRLVINNRELKHQGRFSGDEIFRTINRCIEEKGYHKREKKSEEKVTDTGKNIYIELRPYKEQTHYVTLMIKLKIYFNNVKDIIHEVQGIPKNYQEGEVLIVMDGWYMTEWESRWGMKPLVFFLKGVINKLVYVFPQEAGYKNELIEDAAYIANNIRMLFRSYQSPEQATPTEDEIRKSVEADIKKHKQDYKKELLN